MTRESFLETCGQLWDKYEDAASDPIACRNNAAQFLSHATKKHCTSPILLKIALGMVHGDPSEMPERLELFKMAVADVESARDRVLDITAYFPRKKPESAEERESVVATELNDRLLTKQERVAQQQEQKLQADKERSRLAKEERAKRILQANEERAERMRQVNAEKSRLAKEAKEKRKQERASAKVSLEDARAAQQRAEAELIRAKTAELEVERLAAEGRRHRIVQSALSNGELLPVRETRDEKISNDTLRSRGPVLKIESGKGDKRK